MTPAVDEKPRLVPRVLLAAETVAGPSNDAEGKSCMDPRANLPTHGSLSISSRERWQGIARPAELLALGWLLRLRPRMT